MTQPHADLVVKLQTLVPQRVVDAVASPAAVALALSPGGEILFIRRAVRAGDPWSGQMALPGGRFETRDLDLLGTAIRETGEETGIVLTKGMVLGELDDLRPTTASLPPVVVRPFVFGLPERPTVVASEEVAGHVWITPSELALSERRTSVRVRGQHLEVPAFVVGPHVIWGMTHRIIKPFLELVNS